MQYNLQFIIIWIERAWDELGLLQIYKIIKNIEQYSATLRVFNLDISKLLQFSGVVWFTADSVCMCYI